VQVGEYEAGSDNLADESISKIEKIKHFLQQSISDYYQLDEVIEQLNNLINSR
jgi:flagellar biosynthesis/type III secretory pathway ATPase